LRDALLIAGRPGRAHGDEIEHAIGKRRDKLRDATVQRALNAGVSEHEQKRDDAGEPEADPPFPPVQPAHDKCAFRKVHAQIIELA